MNVSLVDILVLGTVYPPLTSPQGDIKIMTALPKVLQHLVERHVRPEANTRPWTIQGLSQIRAATSTSSSYGEGEEIPLDKDVCRNIDLSMAMY